MARSRRRRLILAALILLVLCALGVGIAYVLGVGRARTDPFRRAVAAQEAGDAVAAEAQLRSLLQADPSHARARDLLIEILARSGRIGEAESFARFWLSDPAAEALGLRALSDLAFRRSDIPAAIRYARMVADRDPAFAQGMFVQIQDLVGRPVDLEGSVGAAESLGLLVRQPTARAAAFLYAAETLRELESTAPDGPLRTSYAQRRERARAAALTADLTKEDLNTPRRETHAEALARSGRIQLLSPDKAERLEAVQKLEAILTTEPRIFSVRASLIGHYVIEGEIAKAVAHARLLGDAPPLVAIRAISWIARGGARAEALEVLDGAASVPAKVKDLLRARLLVGGDAAEREKGMLLFERLAKDTPSDLALVQECYRRIRTAGDPDRAMRMLDAAAAHEPKLRAVALIERIVATSERGGEDPSPLLVELGAVVESGDLLGAFLRLQQVPKVGEATAFAFLDRALEGGKATAGEVRMFRAAATVARPGKAPDGRTWDVHAREDLAWVVADPKSSVPMLLRAATLARVARAYRLLGTLLARAMTDPSDVPNSLALFLQASRDPDDAARDLISQGLREAPQANGEFGPWLAGLADALSRGDPNLLRRPSADAVLPQGRPQPMERILQVELAGKAGDWVEAEAFARALLAAAPDRAENSERLGAVLLGAKKYEEVLHLHDQEKPTAAQRMQRIQAQWGLGRKKEAVAEARLLVRETEGSDRSLIVLGWLLREGDPTAALSTLASVAGNPEADLLRAELLQRRGDEDAAVQVYEDLLRASGDRNVTAWQGMARVRTAQNDDRKFVERISAFIEAPPRDELESNLAALRVLRGQAYEQMGDYERALADYRWVIDRFPKDPVALNNAAWIMGADLTRRPADAGAWHAQALEFADRAIATAAGVAPMHHTRAKVLIALGRRDDALAAFDRAIGLMEAGTTPEKAATMPQADLELMRGRLARYLLDKAGLLEAKGEVGPAKAVYGRVRDQYPGTHQANVAKEALSRLGG